MMKRILLNFIQFYKKFISPLLGPNCRFYPTCSCYAHEAIEKHGVFRGLLLGVKRILKCHPWGGTKWVDLVPEKWSWSLLIPSIFKYKNAQQNLSEERQN
jgi:hypothetical protein